jgi:hypothetical protein
MRAAERGTETDSQFGRRASDWKVAKRGAREYGPSMEILLLIALVIVAIIAALAVSPLARRNRDASEDDTRATASSDGADSQFKRWPNRREPR